MAKPNWKKIAAEYIKTDIAMRPLAERYGVPVATLKARAQKELWSQQRNDYRVRVGIETAQKNMPKAIPKVSPKDVDKTAAIFRVTDKALEAAELLLEKSDKITAQDISAIMTAVVKAKEVRMIKSALDEQEQRARIASLEKDTEIKAREPVQIQLGDTEDYSL